jgi:hypothetical protein
MWAREEFSEMYNFRSIYVFAVLYGGCLVLMIIGILLMRYLYRLQKEQNIRFSVWHRVGLFFIGTFTVSMPLWFSDFLLPVFLSSLEILFIGTGYFCIILIYIYLSMKCGNGLPDKG